MVDDHAYLGRYGRDRHRSHLDRAYYEFMQTIYAKNMFLCIIPKLFFFGQLIKIVYGNATYWNIIFVSENLWINIETYLYL